MAQVECIECWEPISDSELNESVGYDDDGNLAWVCLRCQSPAPLLSPEENQFQRLVYAVIDQARKRRL